MSPLRPVVILALGLQACQGADPIAAQQETYQRALEQLATDPENAWSRCQKLSDPGLAGDCKLAVMEAMAQRPAPDSAWLLQRCAEIEPSWVAHECAFQVAERRDDPAACGVAGPFEDDCRLHLLSSSFTSWADPEAPASDRDQLALLAEQVSRVGLGADDARAWSAWFRWVLGRSSIMDRSACLPLPSPLREACWETGRALYNDRLNHLRDRGLYPCDGSTPPTQALHTPDEELQAILQDREARELCPP